MPVKNVITGVTYSTVQDAMKAVVGPGQRIEVGPGPSYVFVDHETLPVFWPKTEVFAAASATPSLTKTSTMAQVTILDVKRSAAGSIISGLRFYGHGPFKAAMLDQAVTVTLARIKFFGDNGLIVTHCSDITLNDVESDDMTGYGIYVGGGVIPIDPATGAASQQIHDQPWTVGLKINRPVLRKSKGQHCLRLERGMDVHVTGGSITGTIDVPGLKNAGYSIRTAIGVWTIGTVLNCNVGVGPKEEGDVVVQDVHFDQIDMQSGHFDFYDGIQGTDNCSITNSTLSCSGTTGACISVANGVKNLTLKNLRLDHTSPTAVWCKGLGPNVTYKDIWFRGKKVA